MTQSLPIPVSRLIDEFQKLPGIGPKTAQRLTFHLLRLPKESAENLSSAIRDIKERIILCSTCFNITDAGREVCMICENPERDPSVLCVVEDPLDVLALERTRGYEGRYHVLQGALSPIEGIGPDDLRITELIQRVDSEEIGEIILATNPSLEGDATAMYIRQRLQSSGVQVTRLARGLPVGGDLEYADQNTLLRALSGRQEMG